MLPSLCFNLVSPPSAVVDPPTGRSPARVLGLVWLVLVLALASSGAGCTRIRVVSLGSADQADAGDGGSAEGGAAQDGAAGNGDGVPEAMRDPEDSRGRAGDDADN